MDLPGAQHLVIALPKEAFGMDPLHFGKYQLLRRLDSDTMSEVFLARDNGAAGASRALLIKRIHPHLAESSEFVGMLKREALIATSLHHPVIAQTYEFGEMGDTYFLVMEHVDGMLLWHVMRRAWQMDAWLSRPLAIFIVARVCEALRYAHSLVEPDGRSMKVVHRGISPQSIFIGFNGAVKVSDFGFANVKDFAMRSRLGTRKDVFAYMAPEQAAGKTVDHRVDIFAMGVVLYELLTGVRPLMRDTEPATLNAALQCEIQPPSRVADVPTDLDPLVMNALARNADKRYRDAGQFKRVLEEYLANLGWATYAEQLVSLMKVLFLADADADSETDAETTDPVTHAAPWGGRVESLETEDTEPTRAPRSGSKGAAALEQPPARASAWRAAGNRPQKSARPDPAPLFTWLHLSDIHVGYNGAHHRWDQRLVLDALRRDLAFHARSLRAPDAIFVTGDIAFSGVGTQYSEAKAWLLDVAKGLELDARHIFTVPGNHDVNRAVDKARDVGRLVRVLRESSEELDEVLAHEEDRARLSQRMAPYLDFAASLAPACLQGGSSPRAGLSWIHRLKARGGLNVRLVGLNTALLAADDTDRGKLRLGKEILAHAFTRPPVAADELTIVLSHHPLRDGWLADEGEANDWLQRYACIHLSGHVHQAGSEEFQIGSGGRLVRIAAGAVHDKIRPGVPAGHGYNIASVFPAEDGSLQLRVWQRMWSDKNKDFRVDVHNASLGEEYAKHALPHIFLGTNST